MALPGHGSGFLWLPCRHCTTLLSPYVASPTPSRQRHSKCQNTRGARTTFVVLALCHPPPLWGGLEWAGAVPATPLPSILYQKTCKPCWCRQAVLRRFLATLPAIGCNQAPNYPRAHPQGVHRDSLGSFKLSSGLKAGDTLVLRTFFEHASLATVLYVIYAPYIHHMNYFL